MKPLKIVIISKNSYPDLGPRAHRTSELAKELARKGNEVIVYSLLGDYDYDKISSETGIVFKSLGVSKLGVTDNTGYYNKALLAKGLRKLFSKLLELPSIELMPMVYKTLKQEQQIDYLITIAHPHTIHWGAAKFVKKNRDRIKLWVADCGDPYMNDPYNYHPWYFAYFEKSWCRLCNYITIPIEKAKKAYYKEYRDKIKIIPQGFDFNNIKLAEYSPNKVPTFAFSGKLYPSLRDPRNFINYLSTLDADFKFVVYTKSKDIFTKYKKELGDKLEIRDYVPRKDLLFELSKMDFLINIKNISIVQQPSKLIDYALTKRPIFEISSEFNEEIGFEEFLSRNYQKQLLLKDIQKYNVENVARDFLCLYNL